jgi:hypothetical protein
MWPNLRSALTVRTVLCLPIGGHWPGASESGRSGLPSELALRISFRLRHRYGSIEALRQVRGDGIAEVERV